MTSGVFGVGIVFYSIPESYDVSSDSTLTIIRSYWCKTLAGPGPVGQGVLGNVSHVKGDLA